MNKHGELITLAFILLGFLIVGILVYEKSMDDKNFIGDSSTGIVYNIRSNNTACNFQKIKIERNNLVLFRTLEEAEGFSLNETCS